MNLIKNKIKLGADKPFSFLHMSDTHFVLADDRDDQRKIDLASSRAKWHDNAEEISHEVETYAKEHNLLITHTGDYIDFVSEANLDRLKKFVDNNDVFFAAGNHEFSLYVGEAFEDADYRNISLEKVQACFKNNIRFDSREINGVNLIAIDNGYYMFEQWQLDALKKEAKKGLPMILFMHTPLYNEELYRLLGKHNELSEAPYLSATPHELYEGYSEYRRRQQMADDITFEMVEYIKAQPLIKAIFCGHLHSFVSETKVTENLTEYVSNFDNVRLVEIE